jgi:hypothetical protein
LPERNDPTPAPERESAANAQTPPEQEDPEGGWEEEENREGGAEDEADDWSEEMDGTDEPSDASFASSARQPGRHAQTLRALQHTVENNTRMILRRQTKGSKINSKMGIKVAGLVGQNEHQCDPRSHEICM